MFVASDSSEEDDDDDDDGDDGDDGDVQAAMDDKSDDEYVPPGGRKQGKRGYDADDASNDDDDDAAGGNVADDATPMPKKKKAKVAPALAGVTTIDNDTAGDDDDDAYGASTEDEGGDEGDGAGVCSSAAAPLDTATRIDNAVAKLPNFLSGVTAMICMDLAPAFARGPLAGLGLLRCTARVAQPLIPPSTTVVGSLSRTFLAVVRRAAVPSAPVARQHGRRRSEEGGTPSAGDLRGDGRDVDRAGRHPRDHRCQLERRLR